MYCQDKGSTASKSKEGKFGRGRAAHPFLNSRPLSFRSRRFLSAFGRFCVRVNEVRKIKMNSVCAYVCAYICDKEREKERVMNEREVKGVPFQDHRDGRRMKCSDCDGEKRSDRKKEEEGRKMKIILSLFLSLFRACARAAVSHVCVRRFPMAEEGRSSSMQQRREKLRHFFLRRHRLIFALACLSISIAGLASSTWLS